MNDNILNSKNSLLHTRNKSANITKTETTNNLNFNNDKQMYIYNWGNFDYLNAETINNNIYNIYQTKLENDKDIVVNCVSSENNVYLSSKNKNIYYTDCINNGFLFFKKFDNFKVSVLLMSCGCDYTYILSNKYEVYSWGVNDKGQLGHKDFEYYDTPKIINYISLHGSSDMFLNKNITTKILDDNEYINNISCGSMHTLISTNKGKIYSCGFGGSYALGFNDKNDINYFKNIAYFNNLIAKGYNLSHISAGVSHSACVYNDKIYLFGIYVLQKNKVAREPFMVKDLKKYKVKVENILCGDLLTIVLLNSGELLALGNNKNGQLANDNLDYSISTFIKIPLPKFIDTITIGANHIFCINKSENKIYSWGFNQYGQINPFDCVNYYTKPIEVTWLNNSNPIKIICGKYNTILITKDPINIDKLTNNSMNNSTKENNQLSNFSKNNNSIYKDKIETLTNNFNKANKENIALKEELNYLKSMLKNINKSANTVSDVKISELEDSNDVMNMFKNQLKTDKTVKQQFEIDYNEIVFEKKISEGGFGIIWKAKWRETTVAVKTLRQELMKEETIKDFLYECKAMETLRHPNIVLFLGQCTKLPNLSLVLEYCSRKSLWTLLQKNEIKLSWGDRRRMLLEIAKGMNYLHSFNPPILHRDLKSLNILIDDGFRPKIADFGWTRIKADDMTGKIGTFQWMAPEVIKSQPYTEKADIYSFGIIIWEFASREPPYKNINGAQVAIEVLNNNLRPKIPIGTPKAIQNLMTKCWDKNMDKRPNFKYIIYELENMNLSA